MYKVHAVMTPNRFGLEFPRATVPVDELTVSLGCLSKPHSRLPRSWLLPTGLPALLNAVETRSLLERQSRCGGRTTLASLMEHAISAPVTCLGLGRLHPDSLEVV